MNQKKKVKVYYVRKQIENETGLNTQITELINDNVRVSLELKKDTFMEIEMPKDLSKILKKIIIKRHFKRSTLGGFSARIEVPEKNIVTDITKKYKALYEHIIKLIEVYKYGSINNVS